MLGRQPAIGIYYNTIFCSAPKNFVRTPSICSEIHERMPLEDDPTFRPYVSEERVLQYLLKANPAKSSGPDEIPGWFFREYAKIIALPISNILNTTFSEQRLTSVWKLANVCPILAGIQVFRRGGSTKWTASVGGPGATSPEKLLKFQVFRNAISAILRQIQLVLTWL